MMNLFSPSSPPKKKNKKKNVEAKFTEDRAFCPDIAQATIQ